MSIDPKPDRIGPVQIFKVTGPVGPFFGWTVLSLLTAFSTTHACFNKNRFANRPRMAGIVPELTHGVPCPGRGLFCPGNVKIDYWVGYMTVH